MPVSVRYEADDYVSASLLHARWSIRRWLVVLGIGAGAAVAIWMLFPDRAAVVAGGVLGGVIGAVAWYATAMLVYLPWKSRRMFRQQKSLHASYEVEWDDAGLTVRGEHLLSTTPWDAYIKRKENARVLMLYQSDLLFQMLPKRCFPPEEWRSIDAFVRHVPA